MSILEHIEKCLRAKNDFAPQDEKGAPQNPFSPSAFFNAFTIYYFTIYYFTIYYFTIYYLLFHYLLFCYFPNFFLSSASTNGGTIREISPPNNASSFILLDFTTPHFSFDGRNIVSI